MGRILDGRLRELVLRLAWGYLSGIAGIITTRFPIGEMDEALFDAGKETISGPALAALNREQVGKNLQMLAQRRLLDEAKPPSTPDSKLFHNLCHVFKRFSAKALADLGKTDAFNIRQPQSSLDLVLEDVVAKYSFRSRSSASTQPVIYVSNRFQIIARK